MVTHQTFDDEAIHLITRSSEGNLRAVKNLCLGSMIEAVRAQKKPSAEMKSTKSCSAGMQPDQGIADNRGDK